MRARVTPCVIERFSLLYLSTVVPPLQLAWYPYPSRPSRLDHCSLAPAHYNRLARRYSADTISGVVTSATGGHTPSGVTFTRQGHDDVGKASGSGSAESN